MGAARDGVVPAARREPAEAAASSDGRRGCPGAWADVAEAATAAGEEESVTAAADDEELLP